MSSIILSLLGKIPKRLLFEIIVIGGLVLSISILWKGYQREHSERNRLESNQSVLMSSLENYRISDSLNAARVDALNLTVSEFKKGFSELEGLLKEMHIKVKRLESVAITGTNTSYYITTPVRDSLVFVPVPDTLHAIRYKDAWLSLSGYIKNREFVGSIESRDTLVQVVHRVPKRFLFIKYGTKGIRQEIVSKNPHTTINYAKYIELKKR